MSRNQSTALVLLVITAFLFYLYNQGKLGPIVTYITKGTASTVPVSATVGGSSGTPPAAVGPGTGLTTAPYNGTYQLPVLTGSSYLPTQGNQTAGTFNNANANAYFNLIPGFGNFGNSGTDYSGAITLGLSDIAAGLGL